MNINIILKNKLMFDLAKCPHTLVVCKNNTRETTVKYIVGELLKQNITCIETDSIAEIEEELEDRYRLFIETETSSIEEYNAKHEDKLDYWVIIIKDISSYDALKEILMKGRAAGIHVMLFVKNFSGIKKDKELIHMFPVRLIYRNSHKRETVIVISEIGKGAKILKLDDDNKTNSDVI